jgi:hypothetical protein
MPVSLPPEYLVDVWLAFCNDWQLWPTDRSWLTPDYGCPVCGADAVGKTAEQKRKWYAGHRCDAAERDARRRKRAG